MASEFYGDLAAQLYAFDPEVAELVANEFREGESVKPVLAKMAQAKIAEATHRIEHAAIEGIGERIMEINVHSWHAWGQKLGYECWADKGWRREFLRDNPDSRVKNVPRKQTIVKAREIGVRDQGSGAGRVLLTDRRGNAMN